MNCTDPDTLRRLLDAGDAGSEALAAHARTCAACGRLFAAVERTAGEVSAEVHPDGLSLVAYDEGRGTLSPDARAWIGRHLGTCAPCGEALLSVPRAALPGRRLALRPWPVAAAAGWVVALFLLLRGEAGPAPEPLLRSRTLTLSTMRGASAESLPRDVDLLRLTLVAGEAVPRGASLKVRFETSNGALLLAREVVVEERDEWESPILTVRRPVLGQGRIVLTVELPSGRSMRYEFDL
jgi:hypothetical protein